MSSQLDHMTRDAHCVLAEGKVSSVVRHVQVPIVDNALCNEMYAKLAHVMEIDIPDDMMCAGFDDGGHDACQVRHGDRHPGRHDVRRVR